MLRIPLISLALLTYVSIRWENKPPSPGLEVTCQLWQHSKRLRGHNYPAQPLMPPLSAKLYFSGNAPMLWLEFAWLKMLLIRLSRTVVSDTNADANMDHAARIEKLRGAYQEKTHLTYQHWRFVQTNYRWAGPTEKGSPTGYSNTESVCRWPEIIRGSMVSRV